MNTTATLEPTLLSPLDASSSSPSSSLKRKYEPEEGITKAKDNGTAAAAVPSSLSSSCETAVRSSQPSPSKKPKTDPLPLASSASRQKSPLSNGGAGGDSSEEDEAEEAGGEQQQLQGERRSPSSRRRRKGEEEEEEEEDGDLAGADSDMSRSSSLESMAAGDVYAAGAPTSMAEEVPSASAPPASSIDQQQNNSNAQLQDTAALASYLLSLREKVLTGELDSQSKEIALAAAAAKTRGSSKAGACSSVTTTASSLPVRPSPLPFLSPLNGRMDADSSTPSPNDQTLSSSSRSPLASCGSQSVPPKQQDSSVVVSSLEAASSAEKLPASTQDHYSQQHTTTDTISPSPSSFVGNELQAINNGTTSAEAAVTTASSSPAQPPSHTVTIGITFEHLPEYFFDTATFPVHKLIHQPSTSSTDIQTIASFVHFVIGFVISTDYQQQQDPIDPQQPPRAPELQPRKLSYHDEIRFGPTFYDLLPADKVFVMKIHVVTNTGLVLADSIYSPPVTLLHDGLKDSPPQITLDVCFFPQKVVTAHLKNCKSKATISKRHKKGLLRNGSEWCRSKAVCEAKGQCSCQAYPQRSIKKGIRKLKSLLERGCSPSGSSGSASSTPSFSSSQNSALMMPPPDVSRAAEGLYAKLADTADEQIKKLPDYNTFLKERVGRLELFMILKEYAESEDASFDVRITFAQIWSLMSQLRPRTKASAPTSASSTAASSSSSPSPPPSLASSSSSLSSSGESIPFLPSSAPSSSSPQQQSALSFSFGGDNNGNADAVVEPHHQQGSAQGVPC
ncbi:hypothetical protein QOT17_007492 [Balamuthia mandrillaris]